MSNFGANLDLVPLCLESESKDELVQLMYLNNHLNHQKFNYMPPLFAEGTWYVWFFADISEWQDPRSLNEGEAELIVGVNK